MYLYLYIQVSVSVAIRLIEKRHWVISYNPISFNNLACCKKKI